MDQRFTLVKSVLRKAIPMLISAGLIGWLLYSVSMAKLAWAFAQLEWHLLLPTTAIMVILLYLWDAVCLRFLFATEQSTPTLRQMIDVRGASYLAGAFNYELGQAFVAWQVSRLQNISMLSTLSRSVVLAYHDLLVLLGAGLLGSLLSHAEKAATIRVFCLAGVTVLLTVTVAISMMPSAWREHLQQTRFGAWLGFWSWRHTLVLMGLRILYFGILLAYATVALWICGILISGFDLLSTIPLVIAADGLPSVAGIGTREAALVNLLDTERPDEILLAMSLVWSTGMIIGRLTIGLTHLWWPKVAHLAYGNR